MYQRGVTATSLDDVLARSGAGKSQLYHYFSGKQDLVGSVVDRQLDTVLANQPTLGTVATWQDLEAWSEDLVALHTTAAGPLACPLGTLAAEVDREDALRPIVATAFGVWESRLSEALTRLQHRGCVDLDTPAGVHARRLLVVLQGGLLLSATFDNPDYLADSLRAHLEMLHLHRDGCATRPPGAD